MTHGPVHVTVWHQDPEAPRVLLVHGTMSWGTECFAAQRPLAGRFRLELMDRRGFGGSPDTARSDYDVDAADLEDLMDDAVHLVGHSYGAVVAMIAAARRPQAVRSLALIEPSVLRSAEDHPVVATALGRVRAAFAASGGQGPEMSPEEYLRQSTEPYGMPVPEFTEPMLRATRTAMAERPCWDAELDLATLAAAGWPKVVVNGTWETAHPEYRRFVGEAIAVTGEVVADRIGARQVRVAGTDHFPHRDRPDVVNALLAETWSG